MIKVFSWWIVVTILVNTFLSAHIAKRSVNWNGNNWATSCDFNNHDLSNVQIAPELCGRQCAATSGCTHFTWTSFNGGTCWMKSGSISKSDAFSTSDSTMVCGVLNDDQGGNGQSR